MHARELAGPRDAFRVAARLTLQQVYSRRRVIFSLLLSLAAATAIAASNVIEYTYDAAGNIIQIARQSAPGFAITSFDPASGPVGTAVTVYGSGFDPAPANNTVRFNGVAAVVSASASGSISTTVPSGATTGPITVTVGTSTATSAQSFVVTVPGAPTITGFTPSSGPSGTSVAVAGTNFDANAGATTVKLNRVAAAASVASGTSLTLTVPASAGSGKITATTATGTAQSDGDFIVPPAGVNAADIVAAVRVVPGSGSANIAVPTLNKYGLVLFDVQPNVYYSVQFGALATSPTTATVQYQLIKPDNTVLQSGAISGSNNRPTIHLPPLAIAGTYAVLLSPGGATLNTNVRVDIDPVTTVDGQAIASSLDFAYQSARFVVTAAANQRVGIGAVGLGYTPANTGTLSVAVSVLQPGGAQVASGTWYAPNSSNPEGNWDLEFLAPVDGTYTVLMDSPLASFANASIQFTSEVAGTLSPDVGQPITLTRVGQDARYTFVANAGDSFAIDLSGLSSLPRSQTFNVYLARPDGFYYKGCSAAPPYPLYCDLFTITTAGTYTAYVDPNNGAYGSFNLTLKQGVMLQATDPPTAFAPGGVSETARFRFTASAGQNLSLGIGNLAYDTGSGAAGFAVYAPNGAASGAFSTCNTVGVSSGYCRAILANLPQTGTYSVMVQPPPGTKISGNINLSSDITGTLAPATPQTVNASRQGQIARFTFAGTAGDSTSVKLVGVSTTPSGRSVYLNVYRPDGTNLNSSGVSGNAGSTIINFPSLPSTGNYTVVVDPMYGGAWQASLVLDPGKPIALDGPIESTVASTGESLRYTTSLTAGQRVEFGLVNLAYNPAGTGNTYVTLYSPSGSSAMTVGCSGASGACESYVLSAPVSGTYSLVITPPGGNAISSGSFALSSPITGTLNIGDPSQTVAINRPGQTARYTFSGTAGQALRLAWASATVSAGTYVAAAVLKPDGSTLNSTSFTNGATGGMDLTALPTTGLYTVVLDPGSPAASMSASISLITR